MSRYILALDQGTTSSRALLFDASFRMQGVSQQEFPQYYPRSGWVEHNAWEMWESQFRTLENLAQKKRLKANSVFAIGITNQRETVVAWDRKTGRPLTRAIVWQCRRTRDFCERLRAKGVESDIRDITGLVIDPYFSASKMNWMLQNVPAVRKAAAKGRLALGTVDSWIIYRLTAGARFVTDATNASRTQLMNLRKGGWDPNMLALFGIPEDALPEILDSNAYFGEVTDGRLKGTPIHGVAGDQQSSLFGHGCISKGDSKNTYGTGAFLLQNRGERIGKLPPGLLGTVAWRLNGRTTYAFEGAVLTAGATVQFLRDQLGIIKHASETETLAQSLKQNDGVYLVPAFAGLGTPHWDSSARGTLLGLTRGTTAAHLCRAGLEAIAYQILDLMQAFPGARPKWLNADGGASRNGFLMQFQADILNLEVRAKADAEVTALGAAMMAAYGSGAVDSLGTLGKVKQKVKIYKPKLKPQLRKQWVDTWHRAVERSLGWSET